jgi:hypothetical protein
VALLNVVDICKEAVKMSETSKFQPAALVFGSDDYCASIGTLSCGCKIGHYNFLFRR